ncbi:hypothetical protein PRUPE_1G034000 [Prunus persica]|uniref:Protein kinase domain-containing protein n=1 Tax=Prunus persica TaxID=3760 RepID=A0A251QS20_PRUPE|nr:serine/threonine-protein kinase BLUS1 [Prunus persica]ONI26604.1 hypothetical protein PRUPE_1G034000 [Prunus persica]
MSTSSSHQENPEPKKVQFPLDSTAYQILDEIGFGVSAVVYKAICLPMNNTIVAIKSIDLDQSRANFDNIRRETKTLSLLSHPNILSAHCSFTVDRHLWVVMPFMSAGSLQSIISSAFPDGLPEPCIAVVLRETLKAMSYLHDQGHLHRDIKAGNILIDFNGSVKVADFGVSASVYDANSSGESSIRLNDVAGTPYWMAPEVIHSHNGYGCKADVWSFGITALELAHGGPPLSNLPPSKSLLLKITKRFRFSDYENRHDKNYKSKKFSKAFKDLVGCCLDQDPNKRPTAERLLRHSFFKHCRGLDFLVKNVLQGLPSVEERFKKTRALGGLMKEKGINAEDDEDEEEDDEGSSARQRAKHRRISGWNFNEDEFDLDPVFPVEPQGDSAVKMVRFGGESIIQDRGGEWSESNPSSPGRVEEEAESENVGVMEAGREAMAVGEHSENVGEIRGLLGGGGVDEEALMGALSGNVVGGLDREAMMGALVAFIGSLDEQRQNVMKLLSVLRGVEAWELSREEQMGQVIERLRVELENERGRNFQLEMELEFLRIQVSGAHSSTGAGID